MMVCLKELGATIWRRCVGYNNQYPLLHSNCISTHNTEYTQQINKLKTKCLTLHCQWNEKVAEVPEHLQHYENITITCQQCGTTVLQKQQFKHEDCCPLQVRNCFYCRKEGYARDIFLHEKTKCPWRKVEYLNKCGDLNIFHDRL